MPFWPVKTYSCALPQFAVVVLLGRSQGNSGTKETAGVPSRLFPGFPGESALFGKENRLTQPAKKTSRGISLPAENEPSQIPDNTMVRTSSWGAGLGQPRSEKLTWSWSISYKRAVSSQQTELKVHFCFSQVWWRLQHLHSVFHFCWKLPNRSQNLCFLQIDMNLTL